MTVADDLSDPILLELVKNAPRRDRGRDGDRAHADRLLDQPQERDGHVDAPSATPTAG